MPFEVLSIDSDEVITDMPEMNPRFITDDSKIRRRMYMSDIERNKNEEGFEGAQMNFWLL